MFSFIVAATPPTITNSTRLDERVFSRRSKSIIAASGADRRRRD
jgi:hypothetical protein